MTIIPVGWIRWVNSHLCQLLGEMGWEVEGWQKCLPDNHHVQLFITGAEGGGKEVDWRCWAEEEEQMRCRGRGGGPKAIVHVLLRTKGSSGSVCKPTAGFNSLTRPHAGHNITDWLPQSRPYLPCYGLRFFFIGTLQGAYCVGTLRPEGLSVFTYGAYTRVIITDL